MRRQRQPGLLNVTGAPARTALAVWGDPIAHSRSPELHAAAYAVLGLPWTYERRRVDASGFDSALGGLDAGWRGLSCTMPLKEAAFRASATRDRHAELTGAVNTLLLGEGPPRGANTDVGGLIGAISQQGVEQIDVARIVGAGRTAASALVALAELGARRVDVHARRPEAVAVLHVLGEAIGVDVVARPLDEVEGRADATLATLPGGAPIGTAVADALAAHGGVLFDAAYDPWPSPLALAWERAGRTAVSGLSMLLHQALLQVRFFVTGETDAPLPDEGAVVVAMRRALDA